MTGFRDCKCVPEEVAVALGVGHHVGAAYYGYGVQQEMDAGVEVAPSTRSDGTQHRTTFQCSLLS